MSFPSTSPSTAEQLDKKDPLAAFRERFVIADPDLIYLDGNSLGRLPRPTSKHLQQVINQQWGERLIRSWNEGWYQQPGQLGDKLARLLGARPEEVILCDTTSINLFKLAGAALRARPERKTILSDAFNFPSDLYILQGIIELLDEQHHLELIRSEDGITIPVERVAQGISSETALVTLTHIAFKSAFMHDMEKITRQAHQAGALTLWDLSHSVGAVPLQLNQWEVDLAVGCTYKYLNGGPGAPAFMYVRRDLQDQLEPPIWGWFGDQAPFEFNLDFNPAQDISRFLVSTPHILSMAAIDPALDILLEAGMDRVRKKSIQQTAYLLYLAQELLSPHGFQLGSPLDASQRGSHVSLRHPEAYRICRALIEPHQQATPQVIPDFRAPDNIRLGVAPLYVSYADLHRTVARLVQIVEKGEYLEYPSESLTVT